MKRAGHHKKHRTTKPLILKPRILLGADHAGVRLKKHLHTLLEKKGYKVEDLGSFDPATPDDYPDVAVQVARKVAKNANRRGILICGTGTGMVMAANKISGIRAAMCYDTYSSVMARRDNDANILTLRSRKFPPARAWSIVKTWISTPFSSQSRHKRRIAKLASLDRR